MRHARLSLLMLLVLVTVAAAAPDDRVGSYRVDSARSEVGFDCTSTLHDFTGRTRAVDGVLRFRWSVFGTERAEDAGAAVSITVQADTIETANEDRDEEMDANYLEVAQYPTIGYQLERITAVRSVDRAAGRASFTALGAFSIHGVTRNRTVALELTTQEDGALHVTGSIDFNMSEHGITPPSAALGTITVGDGVHLWVDLVFVPEPSPRVEAAALRYEGSLTYVIGEEQQSQPIIRDVLATGGVIRVEQHGRSRVWIFRPQPFALLEVDEVTRSYKSYSAAFLATLRDRSFDDTRARLQELRDTIAEASGARRRAMERSLQPRIEQLEALLAGADRSGAVTTDELGPARVTVAGAALEGRHVRVSAGEDLVLDAVLGEAGAAALAPLFIAYLAQATPYLEVAVREAISALSGVPLSLTLDESFASGSRRTELALVETGTRQLAAACFYAELLAAPDRAPEGWRRLAEDEEFGGRND